MNILKNKYPIHKLNMNKYPEIFYGYNLSLFSNIYAQCKPESLKLLSNLPESGLAIVGTRYPQIRSINRLKMWIKDLAGAKLIIISGFAIGIDSVAHEAAISSDLPTIAIVGTGLDVNYPATNYNLRKRILESGGLILSEYPPGTPAYPSNFLQRNRLLAAFSKAVWIIEAGIPSGALNTAAWALESNKTCYTVPCYPGEIELAGNQKLLDDSHALPTWGIHNLGSTWLVLSSFPLKKKISANSFTNKQKSLLKQIDIYTKQKGGVLIEELLNWSTTNLGDTRFFFDTLQKLMNESFVEEKNGLILKIL